MRDLRSLFDLTGRTALVTGAGGGLGAHAAVALGTFGARVMVTDHPSRQEDLRATSASLDTFATTPDVGLCDVTDEASVEAVVAEAIDAAGKIDILVHCAGVMIRQPALEMSLADWNRVVDVNLTGTWLTNRAVARSMTTHGYGRIINTSSLYANIVGPLPEAPYYASKAGVANLTRGLAAEWGMAGVTVNCLAPGVFFPTPMTAPLAEDPGRLEQMAARTLLGRLGDPATDLGGTVVWLASAAAAYVTGQLIHVDGGWSAW
jgi:gluconate 5-dehydrogenase